MLQLQFSTFAHFDVVKESAVATFVLQIYLAVLITQDTVNTRQSLIVDDYGVCGLATDGDL
jgi:hypothetical protein